MWVLIDDERELNCDVIIRSAHVAVRTVEALKGHIDCLVMDHDLADDDITGYDIIGMLAVKDLLPDHVQICTSNPAGRQNMSAVLKEAGFKMKNEGDFFREKKSGSAVS